MSPAPTPPAFVWTKMGAESGEGLRDIVRRKEWERTLGEGLFCWGIGNALGGALSTLLLDQEVPQVLFSPMPSKPRREDLAPASVLLWTGYEDEKGTTAPLPEHVVLTSRASPGGAARSRHYALVCIATSELTLVPAPPQLLYPRGLVNLTTGRALGASQVTAVVRVRDGAPANVPDGRAYPVSFRARLVGSVRLAAPRVLQPEELRELARAPAGGLADWADLARSLRAQPFRRPHVSIP